MANRSRHFSFLLFSIAIFFLFGSSLRELVFLSLNSKMYSHLLLIPCISAYLIFTRPKHNVIPLEYSPVAGVVLFLISLTPLCSYWIWSLKGGALDDDNHLSLMIFSSVALLMSGFTFFYGSKMLRTLAFPLCFLFFMVPIPTGLLAGAVVGLQYASADISYALIRLVGIPIFRDGLILHLPNLPLEVAEECSGIRSTYVLLMAGLLAGHLFLRSAVSKVVLALLVFPIGALRNGIRIMVIAVMTIYVDPEIIHGPLHSRGGPLFFALSLLPLFAAVFLLRKAEKRVLSKPFVKRKGR